MRTACFDLECSNLAADFGVLLCGVVQADGCKPRIIRPRGSPARSDNLDRDLCCRVRDELERHDILVSWNGKRFDVPFLNARLLYHGEDTLKRMKHLDLMYTARYRMHISSSRLDSVAKHLQCYHQKTQLDPTHWIRAIGGSRASMDYIVEHCVEDVAVLAECLEQLKKEVSSIWS